MAITLVLRLLVVNDTIGIGTPIAPQVKKLWECLFRGIRLTCHVKRVNLPMQEN